MNERTLEIVGGQMAELLGKNNENLKVIKSFFPKIKIVSRGNIIKIFGEPSMLDEFERKLSVMLDYLDRYNSLDPEIIEKIILGDDIDFKSFVAGEDVIVHGVGGRLIKPRTPNQLKIVEAVSKNDMVFITGPAGTGKTYTSVALAVQALKNKEVRRIILTRPAVEAGENLGFLPGDMKEKLDPYMQPLYDALYDMIPASKLQDYLEKNVIQIAPLAFMRGRTLDNAFVILDEAQNMTHNQMKMFLTRMGINAKFIITGDPSQVDLIKKKKSGLAEAISLLKGIKGVEIIQLTENDVVRHPLVRKIIDVYKKTE